MLTLKRVNHSLLSTLTSVLKEKGNLEVIRVHLEDMALL